MNYRGKLLRVFFLCFCFPYFLFLFIFGGDHFGSLEWMDNMLTAKKAQTAMTAAVADVDIIALDMAPVYESFYGMCAAPLAPVTKRSA